MLVKSTHAKDHCKHLTEMFDILKKYEMKLNLRKCTFDMSSKKFMGYMVNKTGIEPKSNKIIAIVEIKAPTGPKEVQSLIERITALS